MVEQRYWDKVQKTQSCWFWTASKRDGYGMYWDNGTNHSAHRFLYEDVNGPIPKGLELDHICMNRNCVNPEHLEAVDRTENLHRSSNSVKYFSKGTVKKNFMLYIHAPQFRNERAKSALVNRLLDEHYKNFTPPEVEQEIVPKNRLASQNNESEVCPHGYAKGMCKKADCNRRYKK